MRDLQAVWEADPQGQAWAAQMRQTLRRARRAVDAAIDAGAVSLPPGTLAALRDLYANTAGQGVAANAPGVKGASKEADKLANAWPSRSTRCCTSASTSVSTGPTTAASRPSGWPSSRRRSAGAGGACAGSRPSAASVSTSPPPGAHDVPVFTALRDAFLDSPWSIPATA